MLNNLEKSILFKRTLFTINKNASIKAFSTIPSALTNSYKKTSPFMMSKFSPSESLFQIPRNKKRQPALDDIYTFEKNLPIMNTATPLKGKELISKLQQDYYNTLVKAEKENNNLAYQKIIPKVGDIIEVEYYLSISSQKLNKVKGMCIGLWHRNTHLFRFGIMFNLDGFYGKLNLLFHNPIIKSIKIVVETTNSNPPEQIIGLKNLRYFGHKNKILLQSGGFSKVSKKSGIKIKEFIRNEQEVDYANELNI